MIWEQFFKEEQEKAYFQKLMNFLDHAYATTIVYPKKEDLFTCFKVCEYDDVKVVLIGQDPYHQPNQAHGLCFSVNKGVKIPPSLRNIYKELASDLNIKPVSHGYLMDWAKQGIFMLNAVLSVEEGKPMSHHKQGWEIFNDEVIKKLNEREAGIVFILWGNQAIKKAKLITNPNHVIISGVHPSPLSANRGFFGSKPFSKCNEALIKMGYEPIDWQLKE